MRVIFYKPTRNEISDRLRKAIEEAVPPSRLEISASANDLIKVASRLAYGRGIAVLLINSKEDLKDVLSIKEQLMGMRIILVLPDKTSGTVSSGHRLYPLYLSYVDSDFKDVTAVLKKLMDLADVTTDAGGTGAY